MNLTGLIFLPFAAWHVYRVLRALRSGVFESLGGATDRASLPSIFWFRVARECLLGALFSALCLSVALGFGGATLAWLFGSYVAVYVTILLATISRGGGKRSNRLLERSGFAGRSTLSR